MNERIKKIVEIFSRVGIISSCEFCVDINSHINSGTARTCILFKLFQNLHSYFILSKENKPTLLLEIYIEYSLRREKQNQGRFQEMMLSIFSIEFETPLLEELSTKPALDLDAT